VRNIEQSAFLARRAIQASIQQPDRWTLVDRRFCIRQGSFSKEDLASPRILKAQETLDGPQLIATRNRNKENFNMKLSTSDKAQGKLHEVKGAVKQTVGQVAGNPSLEAKGTTEKNAGKVQNFVGKVEKAVGE
jgi:uncharacterized protein YjbJ (UPF0337 family)